MADDKTRFQDKGVKAVVGMVTKIWQGSLLLACFATWPKVGENQPRRMRRLVMFGKGSAIVCFLWLTDLSVTQTARGTPASEGLSSFPQVLSLSTLVLSLCLPSFLNTWQKVTAKIGQLEAVKLNLEDSMVCVEDQKEDRAQTKNLWKDNSITWKRKQANWKHHGSRHLRRAEEGPPWNAQAYVQQTRGRRTGPTILKRRICQITGAKWVHPSNLVEWK